MGTPNTPGLLRPRGKEESKTNVCDKDLRSATALIITITLSLKLNFDLNPDTYIDPKLTLSLSLT